MTTSAPRPLKLEGSTLLMQAKCSLATTLP